jgi:hypothetical protein
MKAWGCVAIFAIFATQGHADSLGEAAKREQERREKTKHEGTAAPPKVIHEEELVAGSGKDSKGTFNQGTGGGSGGGGGSKAASPGASPSPSPSGPGDNTEVDQLRLAGRRRLESSYEAISGMASNFVGAVHEYLGSGCAAGAGTDRCIYLYQTIGTLGVSIATEMEQAEEGARTGWLNPGEVRAMREKYRMSSSYWDELVRLVNEYRH